MQTENTDFICKNELGKACFQDDMAYGKSKDLAKRTQSDQVLKDKAFKIASDPKYDSYQRGLASMVHKFFGKKSASLNKYSGNGIVNEPSCQLANSKKEKFIHLLETIFGVLILADMQSLNKYNKGNKYLLCAIDLFSRYAWVAPIKDKMHFKK